MLLFIHYYLGYILAANQNQETIFFTCNDNVYHPNNNIHALIIVTPSIYIVSKHIYYDQIVIIISTILFACTWLYSIENFQ